MPNNEKEVMCNNIASFLYSKTSLTLPSNYSMIEK